MTLLEKKITDDTLFNGNVRCAQHEDGYRFSVDAVLLGHFVAPAKAGSVLDLGSGCGVISLILAHRHPHVTISCLELQAELLTLIQRNIITNNFEDRLHAQQGNVTTIAKVVEPESFDLVVCNPPYGGLETGRLSKGPEQAIARHEVQAKVVDFVKAAAFAVKNKGRVAFVFPASRLTYLIRAMKDVRLEPKRLQVVHSYPDGPGKLLLVEAVKNGGEELTVLPPFFVYGSPGGEYTPEMAAMFV
ncbi:MAG: tRNA1(Val) (adenine(37)-N6)-methyltransferase [Thermodesulfobacteriota bacterium]